MSRPRSGRAVAEPSPNSATAWLYGATEVAGGVEFNPATLAPATLRPLSRRQT